MCRDPVPTLVVVPPYPKDDCGGMAFAIHETLRILECSKETG